MRKILAVLAVVIAVLVILSFTVFREEATLPESAGIGPNPQLPAPNSTLIPTVHIAPAKGWPEGVKPTAAEGLQVAAFAEKLDHPRWLYVLPNGDVLAAESNAPKRPDDRSTSLRDWVGDQIKSWAGAGGPSADRITLLRDADGDGVAETRSVFLEKLHSPFGMALIGSTFYVANTDGIISFPYQEGQTQITEPPKPVTDLPAGTINHHWTKNIIASPDGTKLYATVGSNSNVGENGLENEEGRAAIWEVDLVTGNKRIFASGMRNPNGMDWEPSTGALWTVVNERDEIGSDLVPDYLTRVKEGGFYGWPYSYYGHHVDERVEKQRPDLVEAAIVPDYAVGAHTASLGLAFARPGSLPEKFTNGAFIGQHGSWNREPPSGYKVIFVPFENGNPSGMPVDVLTGFRDEHGYALGRPVGVAMDKHGALLVADDVGNKVWRVTSAEARRTTN